MSAEFVLAKGAVTLNPSAVGAIRGDLDAIVLAKPDFWNVVSQIELRVYESLSRDDLAQHVERIIAAFDDLHLRVPQEWMWSSVHDQAKFVLDSTRAAVPRTRTRQPGWSSTSGR